MVIKAVLQASVDIAFKKFGEDFLYEKPGYLSDTIKVMPEAAQEDIRLFQHQVMTDVGIFTVRASEVPNPEAGDLLTRLEDREQFVIEGVPEADSRGILWQINARPVG